MLILDKFSINMLRADDGPINLQFHPVTLAEARELVNAANSLDSYVYEGTAAVFSWLLGVTVPDHLATVSIRGTSALVGQYTGLREGPATSPPGIDSITWWHVFPL